MVLSKTNTDNLCCDSSSRFETLIYRYNLFTGLYMLEPHERWVFHAMVGTCSIASCLYAVVFVTGILAGWNEAAAASLEEATRLANEIIQENANNNDAPPNKLISNAMQFLSRLIPTSKGS